mmetsp:Transcript_3548/g.6438  ORF Transcript_3548/g.6438 Transcript_3548/m.6438 type:complete len:1298 (-) Transcript_3548:61-3954(-)
MSGASAFDASHEADIGPIVPGKPTAKQLQVLLNGLKKELAKPEIQKSIKEASASVAVRGEMARRGKLGLIYATCTRDLSAPFGFTHDRAGQDAMLIAFRDNAQDPEVYRLLCDVEELLDVPRYTWWGFTQLDDSTPTLTCEQAKDAARSMLFILQSKTYKESMRACPSKEIAWAETGYQLRPITLAFGFGWNSFSTMTSVGKLTTAIQAHAEDSDILFLLKDIEKASFFADGALSTLEASDLEDSTTAASSDQEQVEAYGKPLLGKVVELSTGGVEVRVVDSKHQNRFIDVDGQRGRIIDWDENEESYVVQTFDGETVLIQDERFLQVIKLPRAVEGGTHLFYPVTDTPQEFGRAIADWLDHKGFCMVQMSESKETRKRAAQRIIEDGPDMQDAFRQEIESAYLGTNNTTQVKAVPPDAMEVDGSPLKVLSQQVFTSLNALSMYTEEYFGYECWATTSIWARVSEQGEDIIDSPPLTHEDTQGSHVQAYERFLLGRKICILYMVDNAGGEVQLCPRNGSALAAAGFGALTLPISGNKMLIFRHDQLSYSYQPKGPSFALQSWMLTDIPLARQNLQTVSMTGMAPPPVGENAQVMMVDTTLATGSVGGEKAWAMWTSATDGCIHWPILRWDTEQYYTADDDWIYRGMSYTCHGGFMEDKQFNNFDNIFFGISSEESAVMFNGQRISLETGYTCLAKAGYNRYTLVNQPIGCWVGDSGQDWHSFMDIWPAIFPTWPTEMIAPSMHVSVTALRLSFVFNLKGPASSYDTACSASLIALNAAHKHMTAEEAGRGHRQALVWGANTLLGPVSYISNCAGNMLTHRGRCFTFTSSADGYQRGEGVSSFFVKMDSSEEEIKNRLSTIVGTASAHGGRSASITAPNGPAQTMLIAKSMKFAGFDTADVSVGEMHGTGTSLGDPIEVGSYQAVFKKGRNFPVYMSTQKTNFGHMECNAGATGLVKCICLSRVFCTPPNCHFNDLNPNISTIEDGFPVFFTSEICDCATSAGYVGVSSFGFGGAYSRCDLYTEAHRGPNKMRNLDLPRPALPVYSFDPKFEQVCIIGSWSQMQIADEMQHQGDGVFTYLIKLSDACVERFRLMLGQTDDRVIYPGIKKATADAQVLGPDNQCADRFWVLDGRQDGMPSGAVYQITFEWNAQAKRVWWEPVTVSGPLGGSLALEMPTLHEYFITGSISEDRIVEMKKVADDDGTYHQAVFEMGPRGQAEFQILMDKDPDQTFCLDPSAKTIVGPDVSAGTGKFRVEGKLFDLVTIKFRIADGISSITVTTPSGKLQWGSLPDVTMPDA